MGELLNIRYDWLHRRIIYESPQQLYKLAAAKVAVKLYCEVPNKLTGVNEIFRKVQKNLRLMVIPEKFRTNVELITELMQEQLSKFIKFLPKEFSHKREWRLLKKNICWTSQGTIDKLNTAEALVDASDLDVTLRFQIATLFFLENKINALSIQMPQNYVVKNRDFYDKLSKMDGIPVAKKYFSISEVECDYKICIKNMLELGNEFGYHYYWHRLSEQERFELLEPKFMNSIPSWCSSFNFQLFIIFTYCDIEGRLQLLEYEQYRCTLLDSLLDLQLLPIFDECVKEFLEYLTLDYVVKLIKASAIRIPKSAKLYKKKYVKIGSMLFQHLCKEYSIITIPSHLLDMIFKSLQWLAEEGETELMKLFLDSVNKEWIEEQFNDCCLYTIKYLIIAALESRRLEFVFNCAFPAPKYRIDFCRTERSVINHIMNHLICKKQIANIDRTLSSLFLNYEDIKNLKQGFAEKESFDLCYELFIQGRNKCVNKFVEWCFELREEDILSFKANYATEKGDSLCFDLIKDGKWKFLDKFTNWCFASDELNSFFFKIKFTEKKGCKLCLTLLAKGQWWSVKKFLHWSFEPEITVSHVAINYFYGKFFKSKHFAKLFRPWNLNVRTTGKQVDAIDSLAKLTCLRKQFSNNDLILKACKRILSVCYIYCYAYYDQNLNESKIFFKAMDRFLLACTNNKVLSDLKQELFVNNSRKLYISLPLQFLHEQVEFAYRAFDDETVVINELSLWHQMTSDFFKWICSDKILQLKFEEEFWDSEEALKAKINLRKNQVQSFEFQLMLRSRKRLTEGNPWPWRL